MVMAAGCGAEREVWFAPADHIQTQQVEKRTVNFCMICTEYKAPADAINVNKNVKL